MTGTGDTTRATAQEFLTRTAAGSPDHIAALFAEKVDWLVADNPTAPWIRPRSTREDVADHFRDLAACVTPAPTGHTIDPLVVDGTEAILTGCLAGTVRATGKSFRSPFAARLTVENGLITRYHVYEDSLAVAMACTPHAGCA
ncbi:nuclear transport factor 2 family protein [Streptomyces netropsis]|uniref:SnoaL-like domain-containing protein n=1 Tax=Streptomyces netropsis TaxID=55404 RepID=A0A7W7LAS2_STRNE|nr:nuclear transport factor 2 family protein [Streptomyces netropsis]MBB4886765.1 hypothetical protein [Streptomyces netropsis]GGR22967.1 ketosteroid isomerase [Streptomyces netropsis]